MAKQEIVLSFLQLEDLGLLLLLGASAFVTGLTINLVPKILKGPLLGGRGNDFRCRLGYFRSMPWISLGKLGSR